MGHQAKQKPAVVRTSVPSSSFHSFSNVIAVSPVHFPVEFILLKQLADCMLDTMVSIAGRLEELGICSGFKSQLLVPVLRSQESQALTALSAACGLCFLGDHPETCQCFRG